MDDLVLARRLWNVGGLSDDLRRYWQVDIGTVPTMVGGSKKILVVGSRGAGKSTWVRRLTGTTGLTRRDRQETLLTIHQLTIDQTSVLLYDFIGGQGTEFWWRDVDGVIVMTDGSSSRRSPVPKGCPVITIRNKRDRVPHFRSSSSDFFISALKDPLEVIEAPLRRLLRLDTKSDLTETQLEVDSVQVLIDLSLSEVGDTDDIR